MLFPSFVFQAVHFPFRRLFRYLFDCFKLLFRLFQIAFSADCFSSVFFCGLFRFFLYGYLRIVSSNSFRNLHYFKFHRTYLRSDKNIHTLDITFTFCIIPPQNIHILNYFAFKHSYYFSCKYSWIFPTQKRVDVLYPQFPLNGDFHLNLPFLPVP